MTDEITPKDRLQTYLDEITGNELDRFPELLANEETSETGRQDSMIARIWYELYPILYVEKRIICPKPIKPAEEKTEARKDTVRTEKLAKVLGIRIGELPAVIQHGMPNERLKQRLERTFVALNLFLRIFEDPEERARNLTFPRPELHGKSPIDAFIAGKTDEVLYLAAMSARHLDVLG
jgi:hypothetical protein